MLLSHQIIQSDFFALSTSSQNPSASDIAPKYTVQQLYVIARNTKELLANIEYAIVKSLIECALLSCPKCAQMSVEDPKAQGILQVV